MLIRNQQGITLVELLFGIVLIGICFNVSMQMFGVILGQTTYPLIEKQAIEIANVALSPMQLKAIDKSLTCQNDAISTQNSCQSFLKVSVTDNIPEFQKATYHQYTLNIQKESLSFQRREYDLWQLWVEHASGERFYFSKVQSRRSHET